MQINWDSFNVYNLDFIRNECVRQKQISDAAPDDHRHDYQELNQAFRKLIGIGASV